MSKKIFVGPAMIAGVSGRLATALRQAGLNADFVSWSTYSGYMGFPTEKEMFQFKRINIFDKNFAFLFNNILRIYYLFWAVSRYDIFFMIRSSRFFKHSYFDLWLMRLLHKRVFIIFTGCPERDPLFNPDDLDFICNHCDDLEKQNILLCNDLTKKREVCRKILPFSEKIISLPDVGNFVADNTLVNFLCPVESVTMDKLLDKYDDEKIIIFHLPSNPKIKGTKTILPILEKIKSEYENVELIIKEGYWSREHLLETMEKGHILVESLSGIIYGAVGTEAMAAGCVVMSSYPEFISKFYDYHAIVKITSDNLYDELCRYVENRELLKKQAKMSLEFYKRYHTFEAVGNYYLQELNL